MLLRDLLLSSVRFSFRNRVRSRAAVVAMALGVGGIITIYAVSEAFDRAISHDLELVGRAVILKCYWDFENSKSRYRGRFDEADIRFINSMPGVQLASPLVLKTGAQANYWNLNLRVRLLGATTDFFETLDLTVVEGREFTHSEYESMNRVCVIGKGVLAELFENPSEALGESILVEGRTFQVVGVLGGLEFRDIEYSIIIPLTVARTFISHMGDMRNIYIRVQNWQIADTLRIKALDALAVLHGEHSDSIKIEYYPEKINVLRSAVYAVKILTWSVFIVILLMAQQGILAMMLVSVHERTYEIGLRRSVGASSRDIIGQFLFEAVSIGFSGAALGIILAPISVFFISTMMEVHPDFHRFAVGCVIGLVLGLFAGILAGVKPAVKASRIDIVEAMRFE